MKANLLLRHGSAAALTAALAACSTPTVIPPPTQRPTAAPPRPAAPLPPVKDWRDAPATPGDWTWSMEAGRSTARFAGGQLAFVCDRARGGVLLYRQGAASSPPGSNVAVTISTQTVIRPVAGSPASFGGAPAIAVNFAAGDSLLDAMAFSRGRFAVQMAGLPTLYVPSWPEISRVIEDCR